TVSPSRTTSATPSASVVIRAISSSVVVVAGLGQLAQLRTVVRVGEREGELRPQVVERGAGVVPGAGDDLPVDRVVGGEGVDGVGQVDLALRVAVPRLGAPLQLGDDPAGDDVAADRGVV